MLEGFAFYVRLPDATGQCANPLVPVYRNYNNRAQFNDSNHRYTTDAAIYATMQSLGWVPEGIVFCGAP
jgi:serine protease